MREFGNARGRVLVREERSESFVRERKGVSTVFFFCANAIDCVYTRLVKSSVKPTSHRDASE